jgi:hypothetical protein
MRSAWHKFKVADAVVAPIAVLVMDALALGNAPEVLAPNDAVEETFRRLFVAVVVVTPARLKPIPTPLASNRTREGHARTVP